MADAITPNFKDQEEKNLVLIAVGVPLILLLTGVLGWALWVPSLIIFYSCKEKLSDNGKEILLRYTNFQLLFFIIGVIFAITCFIFIGFILLPVKIPVFFDLIKENAGTPITPQANQEAPKDESNP